VEGKVPGKKVPDPEARGPRLEKSSRKFTSGKKKAEYGILGERGKSRRNSWKANKKEEGFLMTIGGRAGLRSLVCSQPLLTSIRQ